VETTIPQSKLNPPLAETLAIDVALLIYHDTRSQKPAWTFQGTPCKETKAYSKLQNAC
jgi:hypothetical protein